MEWYWWSSLSWLICNEINFGLLYLKKDNTWFILKYCSCVQKACQEAFQAHYNFGKLGGYKGLHCNKYYETQI